nr:monocarboxylate transporter 9-like isoform X1 [Procambarus clarkii]XP_045614997.1 monocarboxylate transporter 9-like isoform X1 [Procambarus clarkii]XP_045614998.1 monocarboxylate transporter 9-like isoform X1 [Procambarus clarkii]
MGAVSFEDEPVSTPLCGEPSLAQLGTIVEAKEGSTSGDSETDTVLEPSESSPQITTTPSTLIIKQQTEDGIVDKTAIPLHHPDIDGGWAWVVLLAMFCVFSINSGLLCTTGMYFVQMLTEFGKSRSYTAWMGSLVNAFFMLGGPISSMFIRRWGCRLSLMLGSVLMVMGYLASAFATSLEMLFVTYGIIVACGMNFAYSGQIIALAQYFDKKQSIATSSAMIGIGLGIFCLSSLTEFFLLEYGWRGSFIWSAGLSFHIAVFGALVFPIEPLAQSPEDTFSLQQQTEDNQGSIMANKGFPSSKSRILFEKTLNDRSFSSLRLSAGASYLSHSILSLNDSQANTRGNSHYDLSIRSNQHSFCSRGSHFAVGSLRSNGYSFCNKDSHAELSHFDLRSNQFSFHNKDSHGDFGLQSNNHSFCSHRDSQAGVSGIKSNPQSFCKSSQMDLYQHHNHPYSEREVETLKGTVSGYGGGRARFLLREGDCDLSCCDEEEENHCLSDEHMDTFQRKRRSFCLLLIEKMKLRTQAVINNFTRSSNNHPLLDARFWLMDFAVFFAMLGTLCLYIIYKDFADSKGLGDYYSMALSGIGIGDLCGRMFTGFLMNMKCIDSVFAYGLALLLCAVVMVGHIFIKTSTQLLVLTVIFGFLYGGQNVLIAVAPSMVFGREKLITVFGHILFLGGLGALIGAPIAGYIVDSTGNYDGVLLFSMASLASGTLLMFMCYFIHRKRSNEQHIETV